MDFINDPAKFEGSGARSPRGVLLYGPPGTGKTLLARAVAGESRAAFMGVNASEFVEMFMGVGAARVREVFALAREFRPCIIFIDELDAIGRARTRRANDEREQALNQMLSEMDGFDERSGVVVIGATNRKDILDPALIRPGRFDRLARPLALWPALSQASHVLHRAALHGCGNSRPLSARVSLFFNSCHACMHEHQRSSAARCCQVFCSRTHCQSGGR